MSNLLESLAKMTERPYVMEKDIHGNYTFGASEFNGRIVVKIDPEMERECTLDKLVMDLIDYLHDQDTIGIECVFSSIKQKEKGFVIETLRAYDFETNIRISTLAVEEQD